MFDASPLDTLTLANGAIAYANLEQGTAEWLQVRAGVATASRFKDVLTQPQAKADKDAGLPSKTALAYAINNGRDDYVERVCRTNNGTTYRFRVAGYGELFGIRGDDGTWITVLLPGFAVKRKGGKGRKRLNPRYDLAAE